MESLMLMISLMVRMEVMKYKFAVHAFAFRLDESGNYFMKLTHTSCSAGANLNLSGKYVFLMFNSIRFPFSCHNMRISMRL